MQRVVAATRAYGRAVDRRPWTVKCLTSATLLATGDVIAQTAVERKPVREFDVVRMGRMAAIGAMVAGPLSTGWYQFLDRLKFGGMSVNGAVLAKTALDQSIFGPTINSAFFTTNVLLNGGSVSDVPGVIKEKLWPTMLRNWQLWPIAGLINFKFIPPQYRILYVSCVSVVWNTYLSTVGNSSH